MILSVDVGSLAAFDTKGDPNGILANGGVG